MKVALILAALLAFLGMTLGWAVWAWEQTAGTEMSLHGWTAITLGIVFTILVGCGLMGLMFQVAPGLTMRPAIQRLT
jgi:hypothetical protein